MSMAERLDPKELVTFEELLIANMYEYAALIELLDRKGLVKKQEILDMIQEVRRKTPRAQLPPASPQEPIPEPYLLTKTANELIEKVLVLLNEAKLTSHQARTLLDRIRVLVDAGEMIARKTAH